MDRIYLTDSISQVHNSLLGGSTGTAADGLGKLNGHTAAELPLYLTEELSAARLYRPPNYFGRGGAIRYRDDPLQRKWTEVV
jgi:hypothetical protein